MISKPVDYSKQDCKVVVMNTNQYECNLIQYLMAAVSIR